MVKLIEENQNKLEDVPLGVLLSEENKKYELTSSSPTSAWWTGGPDSQTMDSDV